MGDELKVYKETTQIREHQEDFREIAEQFRNVRIQTDVERMGHQIEELGEPDLITTFDYNDSKIT